MSDSIDKAQVTAPLPYEHARWVVVPAADIGTLALRLLGVKLVIDFLANVAGVPMVMMNADPSGSIFTFPAWLTFGFILAWHGGLAAILILGARPLAEFIFGRWRVAAYDVGRAMWMVLIVSGIGLAFAIFSFEDAAQSFTRLYARYQVNNVRTQAKPIDPSEFLVLIAPIAKALAGLVLFLKPSLLVTPWLRSADRRVS